MIRANVSGAVGAITHCTGSNPVLAFFDFLDGFRRIVSRVKPVVERRQLFTVSSWFRPGNF